ncbi:hypothetical protein FRX31_023295, partial [Thalictrum thalictroides]
MKIGGLGIRRVTTMKQALLSKWLWRYEKEGESLWRRVIDVKYGNASPSGRPKTVNQPFGRSLWRGILASRDLFFEGISHKVIDGNNTCFWKDVWCGEVSLATSFPRLYRHTSLKNGLVAEHFVDGVWSPQIRRRNLREGEAIEMQRLTTLLTPLHLGVGSDTWEWKWNKKK